MEKAVECAEVADVVMAAMTCETLCRSRERPPAPGDSNPPPPMRSKEELCGLTTLDQPKRAGDKARVVNNNELLLEALDELLVHGTLLLVGGQLSCTRLVCLLLCLCPSRPVPWPVRPPFHGL